jgi:hypothetical protein
MLIEEIQYLVPNAECVIVGEPTDEAEYAAQVTWMDDRPQPSWSDLETARPQFEIDQANAQAQRNRRVAYASESDPLFFQWQRGEGTEQEWLDKVTEIRDRYPYVEP